MIPRPLFTLDDADKAFHDWGANCGPAAVAAVCGLTLDGVRPFLGDFERKGYLNPTLMWRVLDGIGLDWARKKPPLAWPGFGLARIQWHGPWSAPGKDPRAAYRHTHWVGAARHKDSTGVFDVNCLANGSGWVSTNDWERLVVPFILEHTQPGADGAWSFTHVVNVDPAAALAAAGFPS